MTTSGLLHSPSQPTKKITILGSTGSIGKSTLHVVQQHPSTFQIIGLAAYQNYRVLAQQARQFNAQSVVIIDSSYEQLLREELSNTSIIVRSGHQALQELASEKVDYVIAAMVGIAGLSPIATALQASQTVAIANKEPLVCAGDLLMALAKNHNATILPIDSEHNALFQIIGYKPTIDITKLTLTASGGPFWHKAESDFQHITPAMACKHPTWNMGAKISVDSATLMNKGLELIEAKSLFNILPHQLNAVIHPQSIIHALVHYHDGSVIAQLSHPDMCLPIAYAMNWPDSRLKLEHQPLDLTKIANLTFEAINEKKFPAFSLACHAMNQGQSAPIILNVANEIAVEAFLNNKLRFDQIPQLVDHALQHIPLHPIPTLEDVWHAHDQTHYWVTQQLNHFC